MLRPGILARILRRPAFGVLAGAAAVVAPLVAVVVQSSATAPPPSAPAPAPAPRTAETTGADDIVAARLPPGGRIDKKRLVHVVQPRQTLERIAAAYLSLTEAYTRKELEQQIALTNALSRGRPLSVGQELEIPGLRAKAEPSERLGHDATFVARGVYVTAPVAGTERIFDLVDRLKPLGINTVVFDVKDVDGIVSFESQAELARSTHAAKKGAHLDLVKLVARLHARGMHVVAREALFQDRWLARRRHDLALRHKSGDVWRENGRVGWVDPANEAIQAYNVALAQEAAAAGVDEVELDYLRFPAMGELAAIKYSFDLTRTPKHAIITGFLERMRRALAPLGVLLSIDIYGVAAWDEGRDLGTTGQKVDDLARVADVVSPMLYPSHFYRGFHGSAIPALEPYHFVHEGVRRVIETAAPHPVQVRPWLQAFPYRTGNAFNASYVTSQIEAARDARARGYLLWDTKSRYGTAERALVAIHEEDATP